MMCGNPDFSLSTRPSTMRKPVHNSQGFAHMSGLVTPNVARVRAVTEDGREVIVEPGPEVDGCRAAASSRSRRARRGSSTCRRWTRMAPSSQRTTSATTRRTEVSRRSGGCAQPASRRLSLHPGKDPRNIHPVRVVTAVCEAPAQHEGWGVRVNHGLPVIPCPQ